MGELYYFLLDIMIFLPVAWGGWQGYARGILAEIVVTIHFAIAFAISFYLVGILFAVTHENVLEFNEDVLAKVTFACSVGGAFALLNTAGKYLKTEIEFDFPGAWDNLVGALFGVIKYAIVLSFFFWFIEGFGEIDGNFKSKSFFYDTVRGVSGQLLGTTGETHGLMDEQIDDKIIENNASQTGR